MENNLPQSSDIIFYSSPEGDVKIEVIFNDETFWLTQKRMSDLFGVESHTITYHLKEIYKSAELQEDATTRKIRVVQKEGNRDVSRILDFYNLDAIIAVGYRVNSFQATQFRIWATKLLREFIIKGFVLDDERLKQGKKFGKDYFSCPAGVFIARPRCVGMPVPIFSGSPPTGNVIKLSAVFELHCP